MTATRSHVQLQALRARNILIAAHALQHIVSTSLPPLLIFIRSDLGLTATQLGIIVAAGAVASGIFQFPAGLLTDRFTPKQLLVVGYCLTLSGLFLLSRAHTLPGFVLAQAVYGMGNSTFHPASFTDVARATRRSGGLAMGMALHNIGGNIGTAAGYSISAILGTLLGWRAALGTIVGAGALLILLFQVIYPELDPEETQDEEDDPPAQPESADATTGRKRLRLNTRWIPVYIIAAAAFLSGVFGRGLATWLPTFFADARGSSAAVAGVLSTILMLAGAGGSLVGGALGDRMDRSHIVLIATLGTAGLIGVLVGVPLTGIALTLLLLATGFFHSLSRPCLNAITSQVSPRGKEGSVFGLVFGVMSMGGALAGPLVGNLYDRYSLETAFLVISGFFVLHGIMIFLWGRSKYKLSPSQRSS